MDDFKDIFIGHQPGTMEVTCSECGQRFEKWFVRPKLAHGSYLCDNCQEKKFKEIAEEIDWSPGDDNDES